MIGVGKVVGIFVLRGCLSGEIWTSCFCVLVFVLGVSFVESEGVCLCLCLCGDILCCGCE